jgi:hypothetical protein
MREVFSAATVDAKDRGFRGRGVALERRHGRTRQVLNFQPYKRNQPDFGEFFVNVGVEFDELPKLGHARVEGVDWWVRLEKLRPGLPASHELRHSTDRQRLAASLRAGFAVALEALDRMRSARDALDAFDALTFLPQLENGFLLELRARLRHAACDLTGALDDLIELKRTFPERFDIREYAKSARLDGLDLSRADGEPAGPPRYACNQAIRVRDEEDARRTAARVVAAEESRQADATAEHLEERVRHSKFGEGVVIARDGSGPAEKLKIRFADQVRLIEARFVVPV